MNYVGIDWAYGRAAWCAMSEAGEIEGEGPLRGQTPDGKSRQSRAAFMQSGPSALRELRDACERRVRRCPKGRLLGMQSLDRPAIPHPDWEWRPTPVRPGLSLCPFVPGKQAACA
jgi:hypothetical protein